MMGAQIGDVNKEALMEILKRLNSIPFEDEAPAMEAGESEDEEGVIDLGELTDESENGPLAKLLAMAKPQGKGLEMKQSAVKVLKDEDAEDEETEEM